MTRIQASIFAPPCRLIPAAFLLALLVAASVPDIASAQAAAWPATSYSPYFQSLFAQASSPVAAIPSGAGAQAPSIPIPGPPVMAAPVAGPLPPNGAYATPLGFGAIAGGPLGRR